MPKMKISLQLCLLEDFSLFNQHNYKQILNDLLNEQKLMIESPILILQSNHHFVSNLCLALVPKTASGGMRCPSMASACRSRTQIRFGKERNFPLAVTREIFPASAKLLERRWHGIQFQSNRNLIPKTFILVQG